MCITVCKALAAAYGCGVHLHSKSRKDGALLTVCFSLREILLLAFALFTCANLRAQVTIGGLTEPVKGAILDLNSTAKGGLLLSNVTLLNLYAIPVGFPGIADPDDVTGEVKKKFTGLMVYIRAGIIFQQAFMSGTERTGRLPKKTVRRLMRPA
jgi:hypothetical protein